LTKQSLTLKSFENQANRLSQVAKDLPAQARIGVDPIHPIQVLTLTPSHPDWPRLLDERLKSAAPSGLWFIGSPGLLAKRKVGLFCSVRCPDDAGLRGYDACRKLRDEGMTLISGFHSPVEKECLKILLEGTQPIIVCPARSLRKMRIPVEWRPALESDRLLIVSRFEQSPRRADSGTARRRNELVAALSDEVLIVHAEPGGLIDRISQLVEQWKIPQMKLA
jgi:predicted Rossmann fold nucleotide-binding protein DprA/Smf involved in DNA uptake